MIKNTIILILGCLLFGTIGSHLIAASSQLGFVTGVVIFIVGYSFWKGL